MSLVDILTYDPILQRTYLKIDCLLFWPFRGIVDLFFWLYIATFCLPWVPGAPPGGSLGGVPGPMSAGQFRSGPIGFRIKIYVDLGVDFWSYWGRSWVPLGCHFRSFWRLGPPKLVPKPSSSRLNIEQVIFPKNERHRGREHDIEVQVGPRWHPRRPKIAPRRAQDRLG